jgi:hypothetical protein
MTPFIHLGETKVVSLPRLQYFNGMKGDVSSLIHYNKYLVRNSHHIPFESQNISEFTQNCKKTKKG